jgi:hypothetical protein
MRQYKMEFDFKSTFLFYRATGISEVLVTPRYLVKTRRLHRQRLLQSAQEATDGSLMPNSETGEDGAEGSMMEPKTEINEEVNDGSPIIPQEEAEESD